MPNPLSRALTNLGSLLRQAGRGGWWRPALLLSGIGLIAFAATFLLAVEDDGEPPSSAAAGETPPVVVSSEEAYGLSAALADVGSEQLARGIFQLYRDLHPTPTPTPKPTATPKPPTPTPEPPPQPAAPPPSDSGSSDPPPPPPAPTDPPAPPPASCPTAGMNGFAQALFNAANSERSAAGLPPLAAHGCVVYVAQLRSDDMAANNYFSHTSPSGETAFSLMNQYGVPYGWAGENLARNNYPNNQTVSIAIRDLMNSSGHRANILSTNYTHMGVGSAVSGDMKYFTMIFIGPP